jgi:putative transposase
MVRGPDAVEVKLSAEEETALENCLRRHSTPQQIARRVRIVQLAGQGKSNAAISRELGLSVPMARRWRQRWVSQPAVPLDEVSEEACLSAEQRSGSPGKFSAEQIAGIIAIASEDPQTSGYPVSHWTPKEVAAEALKRGVVHSISVRQVGRFLK